MNSSDDDRPYLLRILSGPLRGIEYPLPAGRTQFMAAADEVPDEGACLLTLPDNMIYLPATEAGGGNFAVRLSPADARGFTVECLACGEEEPGLEAERGVEVDVEGDMNAPVEGAPHRFNDVVRAGGQVFAIRPLAGAWSADVLRYPSLPLARVAPQGTPRAWDKAGHKARWTLSAVMVLMAAGVAAYLVASRPRTGDTRVHELERLIGAGGGEIRVLRAGAAQGYVVFASGERGAAWASQALARGMPRAPVRVTTPTREALRVAGQLDADRVGYHGVRLEDPAHPVVILSADRNPPASLAPAGLSLLRRRLAAAMPYASDVTLDIRRDAEVVASATQALVRHGIPFEERASDAGVVLQVAGNLTDTELDQVKAVAEAFSARWGTGHARVVVDLKDDWLKGKSFMVGERGYVKVDARHWYFPTPPPRAR